MRVDYTVEPPRDESELQRLLDVLSPIFHMPLDRAPKFRQAIGDANFRVVRRGAIVAGGMGLVHMGQFFGGRSVSMTGIVGVGIAPHFRARGAASALMAETVRELHRDKRCAVSTLYPATVPVYRKAGYEFAGGLYETSIELDRIDTRQPALEVRSATDRDIDVVKQLYTSAVRNHNGPLDRGEYMWQRVRQPRGETATGYLVLEDDRPTGYLFHVVKGHPNEEFLRITDMAATTPDAGRRLLTLLADHRSMEHRAEWYGGPSPAMLLLLREAPARIRLNSYWMLRIVDVERALAQRGYSPYVSAELHLDVSDDLIGDNSGRYVLRVTDGKPTVERGGDGSFRLDVRALAALFAGHQPTADLVAVGLAECDAEVAEVADALFLGPEPWMADVF